MVGTDLLLQKNGLSLSFCRSRHARLAFIFGTEIRGLNPHTTKGAASKVKTDQEFCEPFAFRDRIHFVFLAESAVQRFRQLFLARCCALRSALDYVLKLSRMNDFKASNDPLESEK